MTTVSNWDATSFFERLTDTNILARNKKFRFCKVSGLQGFEDALATLQTTTAFVCVSDTAEGYTELNNSPRTRRVKTVFFAMRHQLGNMAARLACFDTMRELFRQYMSVLILEQTKLQERSLISTPIYGTMKPNGCRQQHSRSKHRQIPNRITNQNLYLA